MISEPIYGSAFEAAKVVKNTALFEAIPTIGDFFLKNSHSVVFILKFAAFFIRRKNHNLIINKNKVTMEKIKSLADLKKKREQLQSSMQLREMGDNVDNMIQVKVAMATCGIASGAKQVMETIINECNDRKLPVVVTQTGCMGYCYAEPTVEVKKPGQDPVVFGYITPAKATELVDKYLAGNELLDGIIPVNYEKIDK